MMNLVDLRATQPNLRKFQSESQMSPLKSNHRRSGMAGTEPNGILRISVDDAHIDPHSSAETDQNNIDSTLYAAKHKKRRANPGERKQAKLDDLKRVEEEERALEMADKEVTVASMFADMSAEGFTHINSMLVNFCSPDGKDFKTDINLRNYSIDSGVIITNTVVQELSIVQPYLRKLDLTDCVDVSDAGMWTIARHCLNLEHLILSGCHKITNVGLRSISLKLHKIKALNFNKCHLLDDMSLSVLAAGCWTLEELYLQDCINIADTGIGKLARACEKLRVLDMQGCVRIGEFGDHGCKEIGEWCNQLEVLNLNGCRRIEDAGLKAIALGCPKLSLVSASGCEKLTKISLQAVARHCHNLKSLSLLDCTTMKDEDLAALTEKRKIKASNMGSRSSSKAASTRGSQKASNRSTPYGSPPPSRGGLMGGIPSTPGAWAVPLPSLTFLDLSGCLCLTDSGVEIVTRALGGREDVVPGNGLSNDDIRAPPQPPVGHLKRGGSRKRSIVTYDDINKNVDNSAPKSRSREMSMDFYDKPQRGIVELNLNRCPLLTDYSALYIAENCPFLRSLEFCFCPQITDTTIHTVATGVTGLTTLKIDGIPRVTARALMSHVGPDGIEFADMAQQWLGYQPKPDAAAFLAMRLLEKKKNVCAIMIQKTIRRKLARAKYAERLALWKRDRMLPILQAHIRRKILHKKWKAYQANKRRIQAIVRIQSHFRKHFAIITRQQLVKRRKFLAFQTLMATKIQNAFRMWRGWQMVQEHRNRAANKRLMEAIQQAHSELMATRIQVSYRAMKSRREVKTRRDRKKLLYERMIFQTQMSIIIQTTIRRWIGKIRARKRREHLEYEIRKFKAAIVAQRVYRGFNGRKLAAIRYLEWLKEQEAKSAITIQAGYRGYRARVLAAVARSLRDLRLQSMDAATTIQRVIRGNWGRRYAISVREKLRKAEVEEKAVVNIQRLFRGHKGREARVIERELQRIDAIAKPLYDLLHLRQKECDEKTRIVTQLEFKDATLEKDLEHMQRELDECERTNNRYMDSSRINNTPQRFLTKYLRVRLADHFEHEREVYIVQAKELAQRRVELKEIEKNIRGIQRELVPLSTGAVVRIKKERTQKLRAKVRSDRINSTKIQKVFRGYLLRKAYKDEARDYWVECYDVTQGESKYYFNTWTQETSWTMPLAFRIFGSGMVAAPQQA